MNEFKDQLDQTEKDKVTKHIAELRDLAAKSQAGDATLTADAIHEKISETQQALSGLFQLKVYEKRNAENNDTPESEPAKEEKKD